jgi:hypothetical protein
MSERELTYGTQAFFKGAEVQRLFPGAYYLTAVDDKWRRKYMRYVPSLLQANATSGSIHTSGIPNQYNKVWSGFYKKPIEQRLDQL